MGREGVRFRQGLRLWSYLFSLRDKDSGRIRYILEINMWLQMISAKIEEQIIILEKRKTT